MNIIKNPGNELKMTVEGDSDCAANDNNIVQILTLTTRNPMIWQISPTIGVNFKDLIMFFIVKLCLCI